MSAKDIERLATLIEGYVDRAAEETIVRVILTAMREPSEEMLIVGLRARYPENLYAWEVLPVWRRQELLAEMRVPLQAMIDHLLADG